jgi:phasin family protein
MAVAPFEAIVCSKREEDMPEATPSFVDMLKKFGSDLGLPKVDVDKLVETNRRNIDALAKSVEVASQGAKSAAMKQAEIVEASFREALNQVKEFKPAGNPQEALAKQAELARKAFDATVSNTREIADLVRKSNVDAFKIISDRITGSIAEIRGSFEQGAKDKT